VEGFCRWICVCCCVEMSEGRGSEDMGGVFVAAEGLWERKRWYFRRRGAHSE
jgi:hypothetical protein